MSIQKMQNFITKMLFFSILAVLVYLGLKYVAPFLMPFLLGFFIAFILQPIINKVCAKRKLSRTAVSISLLLVFYILALALVTVLGTRLIIGTKDVFNQLPSFYTDTIMPTITQVQAVINNMLGSLDVAVYDWIQAVNQSINNSLDEIIKTVSTNAITVAGSIVSGVPMFFIYLVFTVVSSFFFCVDYHKITGFIVKQLPENIKEMFFKVKKQGIDVLFKFAKAYALLMLVTFVELCIGLLLLRVPYAILWAGLIALVDILPILGTGTVVIPWALCSLLVGNYPLGFGLAIMYAIISFVRQILEPKVVGKQIGLYPLVTLFCMFVGAQLFGFVGLLGLPIAVAVLVGLEAGGEIQFLKK